MPTQYYRDGNVGSFTAPDATTLLTDNSVNDVTTWKSTLNNGSTGTSSFSDANGTGFYDIGSLSSVTEVRFTQKREVSYTGSITFTLNSSSYSLYTGVDDGGGGITWTLAQSSTLSNGAFATIVYTTPVTCRYLRVSMRSQYGGFGGGGSDFASSTVYLSDFRVTTSTAACTPPDAPTLAGVALNTIVNNISTPTIRLTGN